MKRLTGRKENGNAYIIGCPDFQIPKIIGLIIKNVVDRCADIEDILGDEYDLDRLETILSQCMTMRQEVAEKMKLVGNVTVERLREIMEAERVHNHEV